MELYKSEGKTYSYNECSRELTKLKRAMEWLQEPDAIAIQTSLRDLDIAYQNFFRGVKKGETWGFPKFKSKKNRRKSYKTKRVGENIAVIGNQIKIPKLGLVKAAISKRVEGRILNATVSKKPSGKYYVSVCCTEVEIPQNKSTGAKIGLDMGIKELVIDSNGKTYPNHKHTKQAEKKLAKAQKELSRKAIGSNNREKARIKVARIQERIANQRADELHKLTTEIVKNYDVICIEDLAVKNMVKNRKLAKSIEDASWGELNRQLKYKCEWQHKALVKVDRYYASSQRCSECGLQNAEVKDLAVREWKCDKCGTNHDRDVNAAKNILQEGMRLLDLSA